MEPGLTRLIERARVKGVIEGLRSRLRAEHSGPLPLGQLTRAEVHFRVVPFREVDRAGHLTPATLPTRRGRCLALRRRFELALVGDSADCFGKNGRGSAPHPGGVADSGSMKLASMTEEIGCEQSGVTGPAVAPKQIALRASSSVQGLATP
jgi:hypothetical protein